MIYIIYIYIYIYIIMEIKTAKCLTIEREKED